MKCTLEILDEHPRPSSQPPFCGFHFFCVECAGNAFVVCAAFLQTSHSLAMVGGGLSRDPVGICVPRSSLAKRPKKAFGGALEVGLEDIGGNGHATTLLN